MAKPRRTAADFVLRPTRWADTPCIGRVYVAAFTSPGANGDNLVQLLFPSTLPQPARLAGIVGRIFEKRLFSPLEYTMQTLVDPADGDRVVGFTCVKPPKSHFTLYRTWLSPSTWICVAIRKALAVRDWLLAPAHANPDAELLDGFGRVMDRIEPQFLTTPRRLDSWYVSTLAVEPHLQGCGLGSYLLRQSLREADAKGAAAWLVGLRGTDGFYGRFGFETVARANVDEFEGWTDGGLVMMRD